MTLSFAALVVLGLATYRQARLVVDDDILARFREWLRRLSFTDYVKTDYASGAVIAQKSDVDPDSRWRFAFKVATCHWCISVWLGAANVVLWHYFSSWYQYPCYALALSVVSGKLAEWSH